MRLRRIILIALLLLLTLGCLGDTTPRLAIDGTEIRTKKACYEIDKIDSNINWYLEVNDLASEIARYIEALENKWKNESIEDPDLNILTGKFREIENLTLKDNLYTTRDSSGITIIRYSLEDISSYVSDPDNSMYVDTSKREPITGSFYTEIDRLEEYLKYEDDSKVREIFRWLNNNFNKRVQYSDFELYLVAECLVFNDCMSLDYSYDGEPRPFEIEKKKVKELYDADVVLNFYFINDTGDLKSKLENFINIGNFEFEDEKFDYNSDRYSHYRIPRNGILKEIKREGYKDVEIVLFTYKFGGDVRYFAAYEYCGRVIGIYKDDILGIGEINMYMKDQIDYFVYGIKYVSYPREN